MEAQEQDSLPLEDIKKLFMVYLMFHEATRQMTLCELAEFIEREVKEYTSSCKKCNNCTGEITSS